MDLIAALSLLLVQAGPLAEYYKFEADTTWTYKRVEGKSERKIVAKVTKEEAAKIELDWRELDKDGSLKKSSTVTWSIVEGILTVSAKDDDTTLTFPLLKEGSKKGDAWTCDVGDFTHQGTVEVKVPAGTYKDAVRTQLKIPEDAKIDFYVVPKVGLVKIEIHESNGDPNLFELAEFKPAKK